MKASPAPSTLNTSIGKPRPMLPSSRLVRDCAGEDDAAHRPALADDRGGGEGADTAERRERVLRAAGDVDLLLGADDEVAVGQHRLQMLR